HIWVARGSLGAAGGDAGRGVRPSDDPCAQGPPPPQVVDEPACGREQTPILLAGQRTPNRRLVSPRRCCGGDRPVCDHTGQFLTAASPAPAHPSLHGGPPHSTSRTSPEPP